MVGNKNSAGKFDKRADAINSLLCVGLDSKYESLPEKFRQGEHPQFEFNKHIISETHAFAAAYKPNIAFYEARGSEGYAELKMTLDFLRREHPDILTVCDCKRGDTGNTNESYAESLFDRFGFDAVTLNPYMGREPLEPFLKRSDKISMILCRTSNPGAGEIQDLIVEGKPFDTAQGKPLWHRVAEKVVSEWNKNGNCMLVVGATYPEELKEIRKIAGDMTFLVPGIGAQGGETEEVTRSGLNSESKGLIINSSRGIIFAEHPAEEAKKLRDSINRFRK
ncbi:MAG: orotidine-5'-phosphate decarboxylase [Candidatus Liptonbacteria bacterium]|nr:orotidine-5'-phosphate decarboxylase [Candidatus Liptonbacteria bacterium]